MIFTDEMLRNYKRALERREPYELNDDEQKALLARLEAAERVIDSYGKSGTREGWHDTLMARLEKWRKSKGIDPESLKEWDKSCGREEKGEK